MRSVAYNDTGGVASSYLRHSQTLPIVMTTEGPVGRPPSTPYRRMSDLPFRNKLTGVNLPPVLPSHIAASPLKAFPVLAAVASEPLLEGEDSAEGWISAWSGRTGHVLPTWPAARSPALASPLDVKGSPAAAGSSLMRIIFGRQVQQQDAVSHAEWMRIEEARRRQQAKEAALRVEAQQVNERMTSLVSPGRPITSRCAIGEWVRPTTSTVVTASGCGPLDRPPTEEAMAITPRPSRQSCETSESTGGAAGGGAQLKWTASDEGKAAAQTESEWWEEYWKKKRASMSATDWEAEAARKAAAEAEAKRREREQEAAIDAA